MRRLPGSTPFLLQFDTKQKQTHRLGNRLMVTKRERRLLSLFSCSVVSDSLSPMGCSTPGFPILHQHLELAQTHVHQLSDAIQPSHPLLSPSPPALNLSQHQGFSDELALRIRWPKYWSFNFSISPSNEYLGLISFRMDRLHLLQVQGILKSLLQHHSSKVFIFCTQLSLQSNSHIHT